jgi:hypothetical protein
MSYKSRKIIRNIIRQPRIVFAYGREAKKRALDMLVHVLQSIRMASSIHHMHGPRKVRGNSVIVLCVVRNGESHVRSFIEHYQALEVGHIVFLDNGSIDRTVEIAKQYPRVTVIRSYLPYKFYQHFMKCYLLRRFGGGRWALLVDIDELFDYPFSEVIELADLVSYLDQHSYSAVVIHMLDMFADGEIGKGGKDASVPLRQCYPYYDISRICPFDYSYYYNPGCILSNQEIKEYFGGIRWTLFGLKMYLSKHALLYPDRGVRLLNAHNVADAHVADFTCVLYHYKFVDDFHDKVKEAVTLENYWENSFEYKKYLEALRQNPRLQPRQPTSQVLHSVQDILDQGFLVVSDRFAAWAKEKQAKPKAAEVISI